MPLQRAAHRGNPGTGWMSQGKPDPAGPSGVRAGDPCPQLAGGQFCLCTEVNCRADFYHPRAQFMGCIRNTTMRGEELISMGVRQKSILLAEALPFLRFGPIPALLYRRDGEEVEEFSPNRGIMISSRRLPPTTSAGNRVANAHEIWLHSDGTFHKYLWCADWESWEGGCSQRHYVASVADEEVPLETLREAIELHLDDQASEF
jgi:hypothetical protein